MKNNKGFASTFILFGLLSLFLVVMSILLFTMNNSSVLNSGIKNEIVDNIEKNEENLIYKEYTVTADINGGEGFANNARWTVSGSNLTKKVELHSEFGTLPEPYKTNYKFLGWYTTPTYGTGTQIFADTPMNTAENITIYAQWGTKPVICKRATELHTTTCGQSNTSHFCSGAGYSNGEEISFGNLGNGDNIYVGDAFDCDVDKNGTYDPIDERFYYVSDYYNSNTKQFNSKRAILIYYRNWSWTGGNDKSGYNTDNNNGPLLIKNNNRLPTIGQWKFMGTATGSASQDSSNSSFYDYNDWKIYHNSIYAGTGRQILSASGSTSNANGDFPKFTYKLAARLLTEQELANCYSGNSRALNTCEFLFENTKWVSNDFTSSYWLENPSDNTTSARRVTIGGYSDSDTGTNRISNAPVSNELGVRPVIDIGKDHILLTRYDN